LETPVRGESITNLGENHGGDFLGRESLDLSEIFDLNTGRSIDVHDLEWPGLRVGLHMRIIEGPTNETPVDR
jgi:hypothetical protein